jgi:hypothetical protein
VQDRSGLEKAERQKGNFRSSPSGQQQSQKRQQYKESGQGSEGGECDERGNYEFDGGGTYLEIVRKVAQLWLVAHVQ